ncbi:MAG: triose-phosphate isomerase [Anaerolineae bacterium]|jgi:triosephosphate isomerase
MALANWKMEMSITDSLTYLREFHPPQQVQVVLCPPYTALYPMAQALGDRPLELGVQNISAAVNGAHTGEISARLAADAGARWVLLGHWELRRHLGETDEIINQKIHRALEADLHPIVLIGESLDVETAQVVSTLEQQQTSVLKGCTADQVSRMAFVYEPEWTIGATEPAPPEHVGRGCRRIRRWLTDHFGPGTAQSIRILYGGSVTPAYAGKLLTLPDVDGLGAGRTGRDPVAFAEIVSLIAQMRAH